MTPERHERARELFLSASELPEEARAAYLAHHCGDDEELRREVESLLGYHGRSTTLTAVGKDHEETIGRFRVLGRLGKGGMGEVFLARDPRLGRQVALKALPSDRDADPEARRRLESEARALAALNHPHVAGLYELQEVDERLYLVLEHVEGETLAGRLQRSSLPLAEALSIAAQVASGLEAAHAAGVIHRDLKPLNVMITPEGDAKVLDFGLAKRTLIGPGDGAASKTLTADRQVSTVPGMILGTPAYLSPEQARGQPPAATTDVWGFGCLLYESLTGRQAFEGKTFSDVVARILEGEPDWSRLPSNLPPMVDRLLRRCLVKDRRRRLQHPGDARIELEEALESLSSPIADAEPSAGKRGRLSPALTAVAIAIVAGTIGFLAGRGNDAARDLWPPLPERQLSIRLPDDSPVALAESSPLGIARPALALSQAGDRLVWAATTDTGTRLMHRSLDDFGAAELPGTEGAFGPFFSPDGEWIGFFTVGSLRKVPLRGGAATTITEARNPYGAAWTEDGTIYFLDAEGSELVTVKEDGSGRTALLLASRSYWPQELPEDRGLLVSGPVRVLDPRSGQSTTLADGWFARYLDTGHLLYLRSEGNLLLAPFDVDTLELTGPSIAVLDDAMGAAGSAMQLAVARGGSTAYLPGPKVIARRLMWTGSSGLQPVLDKADNYGAPKLSPQGDRLAVEIKAPGSDIWIFDLARKSSLRLTRGGSNREPVWAPDGTEVYFCSFESGTARAIAQRADGSGKPRQLMGDVPGCPGAVSPDGRWMVVLRTFEETGWDLQLADLKEGGPPQHWIRTPAYEWAGRFSPDGRWFAFTSDASGRYEVYIRAFPDGENSWRVTTTGGEEPAWTSDGGKLIYRNGPRFLSVPFTVVDGEPRFGSAELILEGDFLNLAGYSYDVAPDDARLLVMRAETPEAPTEVRLVENWIPEGHDE